MTGEQYRTERDGLGTRRVPTDVYRGIHTLRAVENFPITGQPMSSNGDLIWAFGGHLAVACRILRERCVDGITADVVHLERSVAESIGLVTALCPRIGYYAATKIATDAELTGRRSARPSQQGR